MIDAAVGWLWPLRSSGGRLLMLLLCGSPMLMLRLRGLHLLMLLPLLRFNLLPFLLLTLSVGRSKGSD
jgi:hypothetical protein